MEFSLLLNLSIFIGIYSFHFSKASEPVCSKFAYEEQLLEKMIRTEIKIEAMAGEIKKTQDNVLSVLEEIKQTVAEFSDKYVDLKENITEEMLKKSDEIRQGEEVFEKLFVDTRRNLTNVLDDQREKLIELQGNLERLPVAFHAHHVTDMLLDTGDEIIIFDKTLTNEGTGYDTSTGIFTAPVGGLYQFVVHICTSGGKFTFIGLVHDGKVIAADTNYDSSQHTCSTMGAIVRVKSGQKVWVKSTASYSNRLIIEDEFRMNTFSGVLVS